MSYSTASWPGGYRLCRASEVGGAAYVCVTAVLRERPFVHPQRRDSGHRAMHQTLLSQQGGEPYSTPILPITGPTLPFMSYTHSLLSCTTFQSLFIYLLIYLFTSITHSFSKCCTLVLLFINTCSTPTMVFIVSFGHVAAGANYACGCCPPSSPIPLRQCQ